MRTSPPPPLQESRVHFAITVLTATWSKRAWKRDRWWSKHERCSWLNIFESSSRSLVRSPTEDVSNVQEVKSTHTRRPSRWTLSHGWFRRLRCVKSSAALPCGVAHTRNAHRKLYFSQSRRQRQWRTVCRRKSNSWLSRLLLIMGFGKAVCQLENRDETGGYSSLLGDPVSESSLQFLCVIVKLGAGMQLHRRQELFAFHLSPTCSPSPCSCCSV